MSTTPVQQTPTPGLAPTLTDASLCKTLLSTAARDLVEWLGTGWALAVHHGPDGSETYLWGTPPSPAACAAYMYAIADQCLEEDDEWHLHIAPSNATAGVPHVVAWSRTDDSLSAIALGPKVNRESYSASDCRLILDTVAHFWSLLRRDRLAFFVARTLTRARDLDDDLAVACDVQQRLFPAGRTAVNGLDYHGDSSPAAGLGGDFFDFITLDESCLAVSVGDVSGHGIASGLIMSGIQAYLRRLTGEKKTDIGGLISELNRISYDISPENFFTTLFYAQVDARRHRLQYVSAGHEPALLIRRDLETLERLESTGTVLGFSRRSSYGIRTVPVYPGDTLIVCTDGVCDPLYAAGIDFETEVLEAMRRDPYASAFDIAQAVLALAQPSEAVDDDRTLVVIRFTDAAAANDFELASACVAGAVA